MRKRRLTPDKQKDKTLSLVHVTREHETRNATN